MPDAVLLTHHAKAQAAARGATEEQVVETVLRGSGTPAKEGATSFRLAFPFDGDWNGKHYARIQIEARAVRTREGWRVITVITRFF